MKEQMQCKTCRFWRKPMDRISGECRRNAPKPIGWVAGNDDEENIPRVEAVWPVTFDDDFCGEWVDHG